MKAQERHRLKENEFATTATSVVGWISEHGQQAGVLALAGVVLIGALGGFFMWRKSKADQAGAQLGIAISMAQSSLAPPSTLPGAKQVPGTFPTAKARAEAALKAFQDVATAFPSTDAAITANYEAAGQLLSLGRQAEAEALYEKVVATGSPVYAPMARLGVAQSKLATGKLDDAVKLFTDLSGERDSALPVDGVLMQLAEAYVKAGKTADAKAAYKRVVDEFADSPYVPDARQRLTALN